MVLLLASVVLLLACERGELQKVGLGVTAFLILTLEISACGVVGVPEIPMV